MSAEDWIAKRRVEVASSSQSGRALDALEAVLAEEGPRGHGDYSAWSDGYHAALETMRDIITAALEARP